MNIVFLDCTQNYSYQFSAANTKVELLAKGLTLAGNNCLILNGIMGFKDIRKRVQKNIDGVGTVITYPSTKCPEIGFIKNLPALKLDLRKAAIKTDKNIMVLVAPYIHIYYLYVLLGLIYGYKIVTISHEWLPTVKRRYWIQNVSSSIYSKIFGRGVHAILPISHYIWQRVEHFGKPLLMTPILAEYPHIIPTSNKENKFVYCVFAFYYRVITMIIDSYKKYLTLTDNPYGLTLVLSGPEAQIEKVREYICCLSLQEHICIKSKLLYKELIHIYQTASALLIPLDPKSEQDHARFSQKIAEYLSTGTPVISCKVGEIPYYFKDRENMIFAEYSIDGFANTFLWVQKNTLEANAIGQAGFQTGARNFNYILFGKKFNDFLWSI